MKIKVIIIFTCFLLSNSLSSQTIVDSSRFVKVLSFNIFHGATTKGDFNLDVLANVITKTNPDLVALQEVDFKTKRVKGYDLVTELGWRTKMAPLFGRAMYYDGGEYGEGILSKYSFLDTRNVALPFSPGNEPRAALEALVCLPTNDTIAFVGTHLDHTNDETDRIAQAEKINQVFSKNKYPTILAGDLNATPESKTINILEKVWTPSSDLSDPVFTYPSDNPNKKIDYIMYYPNNRWRVVETKIIQDTIASDHCAYFVILELLDE